MIFVNENKTSWRINDKEVRIDLDNVVNAKHYEKANVVTYLVGKEPTNPDTLQIFNLNGELLLNLSRPKGYQFVYLTTHPKAEVSVVCGVIDVENSDEPWSDFFFGVNFESGTLEKLGVAR